MFMDRIYDLVNAIVEQAADDYRELYRDFLTDPQSRKVSYLLLTRRYFENDCYGMVSIGQYIVERLEKEVREEFTEQELIKADLVLSRRENTQMTA